MCQLMETFTLGEWVSKRRGSLGGACGNDYDRGRAAWMRADPVAVGAEAIPLPSDRFAGAVGEA